MASAATTSRRSPIASSSRRRCRRCAARTWPPTPRCKKRCKRATSAARGLDAALPRSARARRPGGGREDCAARARAALAANRRAGRAGREHRSVLRHTRRSGRAAARRAARTAALAAANAAAVQAAATTHDHGAAAEPHALQLYEPSFGVHEDGVSSTTTTTNGLNGGLVDRSFDAAAIRATAASMASAAPPLSPSSRTPALDELAQVVDGMANGGSLCTSAYAAQAAMNVGQTRALAGALAAAIEASSSLEQHLPMRSPAASSSAALPPQQLPPSLPTPSSSLQSKQPPPTGDRPMATRSKSFERQSCSSGNGGGRGPSSARTSSLAQPRKPQPGFAAAAHRVLVVLGRI